MGCSVGNTKSQLHKARLRLRELLAEAADEAGNKRARRTAA
jgi:DNA-directed RNA polymerase specialized sigma24 family protein